MFSLHGKTAFVTGGSQGIGFAMALALAEAGARIAVNARGVETVNKSVEIFKEKGFDARGFVCDVTDEDAVNAMVKEIAADYGTIDILVNNAGVTKRAPIGELSVADFKKIVDINLTGQFIVAKAVLPVMERNGAGKIINVCSMMSEVARDTNAAYASAKGGLRMLTKSIAAEYARKNIQCNGIGPGYIVTPMTASMTERQADGSRHPFDAFILKRTPAGRWGAPEDLAGPTVFLASAASDFVNGHILYVDGGILSYLGSWE